MGVSAPKDLQDAFYRVVHDFGVEKLARMMGTSPGVHSTRANTHDTSHHKPTLAEGVVVSNLTGDKRIAQAFAANCGGVFFEIPDLSNVSDVALLEALTKIGAEAGDFHRALHGALDDNRISRKEAAAIRREALEWIAAIAEGLARIEGMVDG